MHTQHNHGRRAMSLAELLVVIAIISIPVAVVIPVVRQIHQEAKTSNCLNDARKVAGGMLLYVDAHNGYLPQGSRYGLDLMLEGFSKCRAPACPDVTYRTNSEGLVPIYTSNNSMNHGLTAQELAALNMGKKPEYLTASGGSGYYLLTLGAKTGQSLGFNYRGQSPYGKGAFSPARRLIDYPTNRIYAARRTVSGTYRLMQRPY